MTRTGSRAIPNQSMPTGTINKACPPGYSPPTHCQPGQWPPGHYIARKPHSRTILNQIFLTKSGMNLIYRCYIALLLRLYFTFFALNVPLWVVHLSKQSDNIKFSSMFCISIFILKIPFFGRVMLGCLMSFDGYCQGG